MSLALLLLLPASLLYRLVMLRFLLFIQSKTPNQPDYHKVQGMRTLVYLLQHAPCGLPWDSADALLMSEAFEKERSHLDSLLFIIMLARFAAPPSDTAFSKDP